MLSYQHGYHAGNFADVIKHCVLTRLLSYMMQKDKPLFYLETHSGSGLYDLQSNQSLKTGEARDGIESLWQARKQLPSLFSPYLQLIAAENISNNLRYYPGSPSLAIQSLRAQDRAYCCELHPKEFAALARIPKHLKRVFLANSNGLEALKSLLPPPENRALVFVDPSFELKTEYQSIPKHLKSAHQRFATGVYCLWYPLLDDKKFQQQLTRGMTSIGASRNLQFEFYLNPKKAGMLGCGLWIINPPYVLQKELKEIAEVLTKIFNSGRSSYRIILSP